MNIGYFYLIVTIILDSLGIAFLNRANGFESPKYLILGLLLLNSGLIALSYTLKTLDMTIANTTFAGVSSVLIAIIGYIFFGERFTLFQYLCLASVLLGLVGLNYTGISK